MRVKSLLPFSFIKSTLYIYIITGSMLFSHEKMQENAKLHDILHSFDTFFVNSYYIIGDFMYNYSPYPGGFFWFIVAIVLACMVVWHALLLLIFPFRFNAFILLVELLLLFFIIFKIIWPH